MSMPSIPKKKIDPDKRSVRSHIGSEIEQSSNNKFDEGKIIEHYIKLKEIQQQKLANINLSEELKRKLFGFSEGYYLTNNHDPYKLIIKNHPMKGRFIMTEERFHYEMHNKYREREFKEEKNGSESLHKDFSGSRLYIDSDIEVPFPQQSGPSPNPEFDNAHLHQPREQNLSK